MLLRPTRVGVLVGALVGVLVGALVVAAKSLGYV